MMQKDSKGRKESRALGRGAQGEEPGKEPGAGKGKKRKFCAGLGSNSPSEMDAVH